MANYPIPPWIQAADPASAYARGIQIGSQIGSEQASQQLRQEALLREDQKQKVDEEVQKAKLQLSSEAQARKYAAQAQFQQAVAGGTPTDQALLQFGPQMGISGPGLTSLARPTKPQMPESPIGKLQYDKAQALKSGDVEGAKQIDAAIQEAMTNKGQSIYMGQDDQGKPIFQMTTGGAKPTTVATQSLSQSKLLQYSNAVELMSWLQQHLKPEHVGAAGKAGEFVVDKTLAQILPEAADKDRISVRSALDMAQGLAREIVDAPAGRFSNVERDAILGALPSTGIFESYPDAIGRLDRAKQVLSNRGRVYSEAIGQPLPSWAMSKEQIKQAFQGGKVSGLKPESPEFKKRGFLTQDEAIDALQRFY